MAYTPTNVQLVAGSSLATVMTWLPSGNVGIGTTSPGAKLEVQDTNSIVKSVGTGGYGSFYAVGSGTNNSYLFFGNAGGEKGRISSYNDGTLAFSNASALLMLIDSAGKVGIGNSSPSYKLDVSGTMHATGAVNFDSTVTYGTNGTRTEYRTDAGLRGDAGAQSGFFETSAPTNYPTGATGWWHLIDTRHDNPANNYAMQIAGSFFDQNLYFRKTNSSPTTAWNKFVAEDPAGNVVVTGTVTAGGVVLTSDRRWKRNITPLKNSIEKIEQLNGMSYDWAINDYPDKHFTDKKQIGVIAQDVQKVFPELVSTDKDGYLGVNYPGLVAPLIEAVKELYHKWFDDSTAIHREIASVKAENAKLKQENALIKSYLCAKDKKAAFCK